MQEIKILDHGYIRLVESWGSDEKIVEAARMSTGKGFLGWGPKCSKCGISMVQTLDGPSPADYPRGAEQHACDHNADKPGDEKLLRYLYENRHDTPFEMAGMVVEVQAPIFVFREWHRHRVPWSYNEASARYAPLPALDYLPTRERCLRGGGHLTKQAAAKEGAAVLTADDATAWLERLERWQAVGEELYQAGLAVGVPKELARLAMSVGRYSRMRAQANLRGWFHFFGLRMAPNAQEEIRLYANAAGEMVSCLFPRSWALFEEHRAK